MVTSTRTLMGFVSHGAELGRTGSVHVSVHSTNQSHANWVPGPVVNLSQRTNGVVTTTQRDRYYDFTTLQVRKWRHREVE